jgi:hypothetical protein
MQLILRMEAVPGVWVKDIAVRLVYQRWREGGRGRTRAEPAALYRPLPPSKTFPPATARALPASLCGRVGHRLA